MRLKRDAASATDVCPGAVNTGADQGGHGPMRSAKRHGRSSSRPLKKKNVWATTPTGLAFKTRWLELREKLYRRDDGVVSGVACSSVVYQQLADFVVDWFARRLTEGNTRSAKWAPTAGGAADKATKGVRAFGLPSAWGHTGGISQAIAFKMFHARATVATTGSEASTGTHENEDLVKQQKRQVMAAYKKHVSQLRAVWVPEHLVGNPATVDCVPDFKKATALWMANTAPRVLKTADQKLKLKDFLSDVERGVKGCTVTSGGQKPYVLFEACCQPRPRLDDVRPWGLRDEIKSLRADCSDTLSEQSGDEDTPREEDTPTVASWRSQRKVAHLQFQAMVKKLATLLDNTGVIAVPVSDTSGSMEGVPMRVSVALGALLAMANSDPAYHNKVLSFEEECSVTTLDTTSFSDPDATERSVKKQMGELPWGGSSNLESVFQKVAELERERLAVAPVSKKLVVIVFTDMEVHHDPCGVGSRTDHVETTLCVLSTRSIRAAPLTTLNSQTVMRRQRVQSRTISYKNLRRAPIPLNCESSTVRPSVRARRPAQDRGVPGRCQACGSHARAHAHLLERARLRRACLPGRHGHRQRSARCRRQRRGLLVGPSRRLR